MSTLGIAVAFIVWSIWCLGLGALGSHMIAQKKHAAEMQRYKDMVLRAIPLLKSSYTATYIQSHVIEGDE